MGKFIKIHPENPQTKQLESIANILKNGGIAVIPTDSVYAFACDSSNSKALDKMARLKKDTVEKTKFSFLFNDLRHLATYTKQFDTATYKLLKRALPGPFTFIMEASNTLSKAFKKKKKTVGIRVPDNNIARQLTQLVGEPLAVTSFKIDDELLEYPSNAELIFEDYKDLVDVVIDGGIGSLIPSTVVDLTQDTPVVIRQGSGDLDMIL